MEAAQAGLIPNLTSTNNDFTGLEAHTTWKKHEMTNVIAWASTSSKAFVRDVSSVAKVASSLDMVRWWPYGGNSDGAEVCLDIFVDREPEEEVKICGGLRWDVFGSEAGLESRASPKHYAVTW